MQCHIFLRLRKTRFSYLVLRCRLAACRLGVACVWMVCVRTHMRVVKMATIARTVRQKNALALQRSSFRENPTYFLTSICRWICELVFDAIYDWRSEFSHSRQTDRQTDPHDNYRNPRCACAPRVNWASGSGRTTNTSIPQLSTRFFLRVISIFPEWALHCTCTRISASQLRQSMLTQTSTAHGDLSLAAPMLTARFSYLVVQLARFSIDADSDFHSTRRPVSSSANAHCQV